MTTSIALTHAAHMPSRPKSVRAIHYWDQRVSLRRTDKSTCTQLDDILSWFKSTQIGATATLANHPSSSDSVVPAAAIATTTTSISIDHSNHTKSLEPLPIIPKQQPPRIESTSDTHSLTHILESFKSTHLASSHAASTTAESKESMTAMEDVHVATTTPPESPSPLPKSHHRRPETLSFLSDISFGDSHRRYDEHITEIGLDEPEVERAHLVQMVRLSEPRMQEFKDEETYETVYKKWYIQEGYLLSGQREPKSPVAPGVIQATRTSRKILGIPEPEEFRRSLKVSIKLKGVETWSGRFAQPGIVTETVEEEKKNDSMEIDESVHPIVEYESSKVNHLASHEQLIDAESVAPKDETLLEVALESLLSATAGFLPTSTPIAISSDQSNDIRPTIPSSYASVVTDVIGKVVDAAVTFAQRFTVSTAPQALATDSIATDLASSTPVDSTADPSPTMVLTSCQGHTTSEPTCMYEETKSVTSEAEETKSVSIDADAPSHPPSIATPKPTRRSYRAAASLANQRRRGLTSDYVAGIFLRPSHLVQMVQLLQGRPDEVDTLVEAKEEGKTIPIKMEAAESGESSVMDTLTPSTNDASQQRPSSSKSMIDPTSSDVAMSDLSKLIPTHSPQLDSVPTSTNQSSGSASSLSVSVKVAQTATGPKVPFSSSGLIMIDRHCRDCPQLFQVKSTSRRVLCDPCYHKIQQITKDHASQQATLQLHLATSDLSTQQQAAEGIVKLQQTIFLESRLAAPSPSIQQKSLEPLSTSPTVTTDGRSSTEILMADSFSATDSNSPLAPLVKVDELVTGTDSPTSNSAMSQETDSPLNHVPSMLVSDSPTCREGQTEMTDSPAVTDVTPTTHHEQPSNSSVITDQEMKVDGDGDHDDEEEEEEEEDDEAASINSSGSASTHNSPSPNSKPARRKAIRRVCEHCRWSARARCDPTDAHCDLHTERGKRERQVSLKLTNFVVLVRKQPNPDHGKKHGGSPLNQQRVKKTGVSSVRSRSTTTTLSSQTMSDENASTIFIRTTPKGRGPYKKRIKSIESAGELYCICQTPYDKRRAYLACDCCDQWFHLTCVGMNEDDDVEAIEWICQKCQLKKSAPFTRSSGTIKTSTIPSDQSASSTSSPVLVASILPSLQQRLAPIPTQMMSILSKSATHSTVTSASSYAFPSFAFFGEAAVGIRDSLARSTRSLRGSKRKHQEVEDEQKEKQQEEESDHGLSSNEDEEEDDDDNSKSNNQPMEEVTPSTAGSCTSDSSSLITVTPDELATKESQSESKDHAKSSVKSIKDRHNKSRIKCRFEGCYHFNEPRRATVHEKDCPFQELDVIKRTEDLKLNYHFCDTCQLYWSNSNELGRSGSFQTHQRSCSPSNPSAESQLSATKIEADVTPTDSSADEPKKKKTKMTTEMGSQPTNEHDHDATMKMKISPPAASTRSKEKVTTTHEIRTRRQLAQHQ